MANWLDGFESAILFRLARALTLVVVVLGLLVVVVNALGYLDLLPGWRVNLPSFATSGTRVDVQEVRSELLRREDVSRETGDVVAVPESTAVAAELDRVAALFDPKTYDIKVARRTVSRWTDALDDDSERLEFLKELAATLNEFSPEERGPAADAYHELKLQKTRYEQRKQKAREWSFIMMVVGLGMVAMFSLILVLLRIERNTRPLSNS